MKNTIFLRKYAESKIIENRYSYFHFSAKLLLKKKKKENKEDICERQWIALPIRNKDS